MILEAPTIISRAQKLPNLTQHQQWKEMHDLLEDCWQLDDNLTRFYDDLLASTNGLLYWPVLSTMAKSNEECLFLVDFQFIDSRLSMTLMMLWAVQCMLWSGMCHLQSGTEMLRPHFQPLSSTTASPVRKLDHRSKFITAAHNVCQSVTYCTRDSLSLPIATAPLNMVLYTLREWGTYAKEEAWIHGKLEQIRRRGVGITPYLPSS